MRQIVSGLLVALFCGASIAHADGVDSRRQLSVQGQAERMLEPDIANLQLSVEGRASSSSQAMNRAGRNTQLTIDAINPLTTKKSLRATQTQLRQVVKGTQRSWRRDGGEAMEWLATRQVQINQLAIGKLPDLMQVLAGLPLASIDNLQTGLRDPQKLQDELLLLAIDDAKARAQRMAKRLGVGLGLPLQVHTQGQNSYQPVMGVRAMAMESKASAGYEAVGETRLQAQVQIVFELEAP